MKMSLVGVGRPPWTPHPNDFSHQFSSALIGKCAAISAYQKFSQQTSPSGSFASTSSIGGLVSSHRYGVVSFVGLRGLPKTKDVSRFGSRCGELSGDGCQTSGGTTYNCKGKNKRVRATAISGSKGADDSRNDGEGDETGSSPVWDLPARHKRIQEAAAKVGDPFRDMMTNASKKLQDYLDNIKLSRSKEDLNDPKPESEWERWQKVFAEVDERERLVSVLKFQMEEAVDNEDFQEAATLKQTIISATANDAVCEVMSGFKSALGEERYSDAAILRDKAGAGLVGWWVGLADGGNDPYGRIIHISAAQGRFLAKSYSARQLATAAAGMPLFEVFIRKREGMYDKQAVYLQRDGNVAGDVLMGPNSKEIDVIGSSPKTAAKEDLKKDMSGSSEKDEDKSKDSDFIDEGLNNILSFLKDRMPDVKLKVLQVIAPDGLESELPKLVEQLMETEEKEEDETTESDTEVNDSESSTVSKSEEERQSLGNSNVSRSTDKQETPVRLVIGGVLQTTPDDKVPRAPLRVAAKMEHKSKDEFVFHIEDTGTSSAAPASAKEPLPSWKVATIATQASADLMPDDVAKVLWNVEKVPVKVSKEMGEIIRLAVSQAQRRRGLSKSTSFRRIHLLDGHTDPLSGLYIGSFGPYTSEVVQLRRKYGQWQEDESKPNADKLEFFEYVEAVKLTGDLNVPAGQVTFRAKIGRENRLSLRGAYPEELGVVGRYKGQGRLAEPGFRNPQWIDGEMVLLDGKQGGGHTNGAELGFVYSVPERHFLVLFNRLKLQD